MTFILFHARKSKRSKYWAGFVSIEHLKTAGGDRDPRLMQRNENWKGLRVQKGSGVLRV